jgi:ABC-type sugar transport system permease subunit
MMDAQVSFSQSMAIVMYGWLPGIFTTILTIFTLSFGDPEGFRMENPVGTNPAHFMDPASMSKFLYSLLTSVDVISLWIVVLIGIGFAVTAKKKISTGAAIGTVAVWYFIAKVCAAGFASLGG